MNPLSYRKACAAAKVVGCIVAIPLLIVVLLIPYMSVAVSTAIVIILLWHNRNNLPVNQFKAALVGLAAGVAPLVTAVFYPVFASKKEGIELTPVILSNMLSIITGFTFLIVVGISITLTKYLFDYFMDVCQDSKESELPVKEDPEARKTETDGMAT